MTSLCQGRKERRLVAVIESGCVDLTAMVSHLFRLDDIEAAYERFVSQEDGVFKIAITS